MVTLLRVTIARIWMVSEIYSSPRYSRDQTVIKTADTALFGMAFRNDGARRIRS